MKNNHKAIVLLAISTLSLQAQATINSPDEAFEHVAYFITQENYTVMPFKTMCLALAEQLQLSHDTALQDLGNTLIDIAHFTENELLDIARAIKKHEALFKQKGYKPLNVLVLKKRLIASLRC